jgi:hypothetical protein
MAREIQHDMHYAVHAITTCPLASFGLVKKIYMKLLSWIIGTSLGDLIDQLNFDHRETFSYASQMVRL